MSPGAKTKCWAHNIHHIHVSWNEKWAHVVKHMLPLKYEATSKLFCKDACFLQALYVQGSNIRAWSTMAPMFLKIKILAARLALVKVCTPKTPGPTAATPPRSNTFMLVGCQTLKGYDMTFCPKAYCGLPSLKHENIAWYGYGTACTHNIRTCCHMLPCIPTV